MSETPKKDYHRVPSRILARVNDEDWKTLKDAAQRAGKPFARWAMEILLKAAKRQK